MKDSVNILLTGATGILGSEVMYQLLAAYASGELSGKLLLIIRSIPEKTAEERLVHMLEYQGRPQYLHRYSTDQLKQHVEVIDAAYYQLSPADVTAISAYPQLYVIHGAASTNLNNTDDALREIYKLNYQGTLHLLEMLTPHMKKFIFISSILSKNNLSGLIPDEYLKIRENGLPGEWDMVMPVTPYGLYKMITERQVVTWCEEHRLEWQILRPAQICGRLIHEPLYHITRFNVFYLVGIVLHVWKLKHPDEIPLPVRIVGTRTALQSLVPVDYTALTVCRAFRRNDIKQLNIALSEGVPLGPMMDYMAEVEELEYVFTDHIPRDLTPQEAYYYDKVGERFARYMTLPFYNFETTQIRAMLADVPEPDTQGAFKELYHYAFSHHYRTAWEDYRTNKKKGTT